LFTGTSYLSQSVSKSAHSSIRTASSCQNMAGLQVLAYEAVLRPGPFVPKTKEVSLWKNCFVHHYFHYVTTLFIGTNFDQSEHSICRIAINIQFSFYPLTLYKFIYMAILYFQKNSLSSLFSLERTLGRDVDISPHYTYMYYAHPELPPHYTQLNWLHNSTTHSTPAREIHTCS
jgi:hypothetical protein